MSSETGNALFRAPIECLGPGIGKVYYFALDGVRWRIYDQFFDGTRLRAVAPPSDRATARVFVSEDPKEWKRHYTFARGESRALTEALLERQLRGAGFRAKEKFNAEDRGPR